VSRVTDTVETMTGADRLLAAARCEPVDRTPVWFMRQAGGSLPRYLEIREHRSVEDVARSPELAAEVSLMPVEAYGVDGAVMFADIMLPLTAMGIDLRLTATGPVIDEPIRSVTAIERLRPLDPEAHLRGMLDAIGIVRRGLGGRAALIGIVGAPFTLACYLVEGGPSRDHVLAKAFMYREPEAWHRLLTKLADALVAYVDAQVVAGIQILQVFDSWASTLGPDTYARCAGPYSAPLFRTAAAASIPSIHFAAGSAGILEGLADTGGDVIAIDAGQSLAGARARLGEGRAVQGNLDPARVLAGWPAVEEGAARVLDAADGRPGHVFNLGHAAPSGSDPAILRDLAGFVHDHSRNLQR
jgi:uroporphyrinogen decarboxylase